MTLVDNVYRELADCLDRGEKAVLMTIIETNGSVPNKVGAKMLIYSDGRTGGTVGGGPSEARAIEEAKKIFNTRTPAVVNIDLTPGREDSVEAMCGGSLKLYMEPVNFNSRLIIFGGGHVGLELSKTGKQADFKVTVIDDRPEFSGKERFLAADEVICKDVPESVRDIAIDSDTYIVIVTRGHKHDYTVLKALLERKEQPAYTGMIGSKKKVSAIYKRLVSDGIDKEKLQEIYSPIGLDIGGASPGEIAVSIIGEILMVKYSGNGSSLRDIHRLADKL